MMKKLLVLGFAFTYTLFGQTQVELSKQVKGTLPPSHGGTGLASCGEDEVLVWQSGAFVCTASSSGPHATTHQHGGTDEVATATPADNAIPKAGPTGSLAEGWIPSTISRDTDSPAPGDIGGSLSAGYTIVGGAVGSDDITYDWRGAHNFGEHNGILLSTALDWSQIPGGSLVAGPNTVTLSPCPRGVSGTNANHYLYIDDNNDSLDEAVLITGGTCSSEASSGTVEFAVVNAHSDGSWQIGSATDGLQECVWAFAKGGPDGGVCMVPPGTYLLHQTLTIGNGGASLHSRGGQSDIQFVTIQGAGFGEQSNAAGFAYTTQLKWAGPAYQEMIVVEGETRGIGLVNMKINGSSTSGDMLSLYNCEACFFKNLALTMGNADTTGIAVHNGTRSNIFENVYVIQQADGATAWTFGENADPASFGISQNVVIRCKAAFAGNKDTSYGFYFEGADNNTVIQSTAAGNILFVADATNTAPIVITTSIDHLRQTGDTVRIFGVKGNLAANGIWTITKIDANEFSLDGSSGNGAYTSGGEIWGPGHGLKFKSMPDNPIFPLENAFYNVAAFRGFVTSEGNHSANMFLPFPSGDAEIIPSNSGKTYPAIAGIAHPDYYANPSRKYLRFVGRYEFLNDDNDAAFVRLHPDTEQVTIGDINSFSPLVEALTIVETNADADVKIVSQTSGNAVLRLQAEETYNIKADRLNDLLVFGAPGVDFVRFEENNTGRAVFSEAVVPGDVTAATLPTRGFVYCTDCNQDSTCTAGGAGAWARCRSSACACNW